MTIAITLLSVMTVITLVAGQGAVYQPVSFPLTGYFQPLTFPSLPNTNVYQQPQQQSIQQTQQQSIQQTQQDPQQGLIGTNQQTSIAQTATATGALISDQYQPQPQQQTPVVAGPSAVVNNIKPDGTYAFGYQTPDGQMRAESVQADGTRVGSYTYKTPEGQLITINYTAGKHGFQTSPGSSVPASSASTGEVAPLAATTATATGSVAAPSPTPTSGPVVTSGATTGLVQPLVLYSPTSQLGLPSFYPFNRFTTQTATAEQSQVSANPSTHIAANQPTPTTPAIAPPVGFSYGSNPQAIQQLQRLLLV